HLERRDNLLAAIHMLVEALFWFYPLVWWLGTRLEDERERACDEAVLARGAEPLAYAESILKVCKFYLRSPLPCVAGVSGADLKERMQRIMRNRSILRLGGIKKVLLASAAIAVLAVPLALGIVVLPSTIGIAIAQEKPRPHPGTENWIRRQIAGYQKHQPVF